jgi:hypothetical protein
VLPDAVRAVRILSHDMEDTRCALQRLHTGAGGQIEYHTLYSLYSLYPILYLQVLVDSGWHNFSIFHQQEGLAIGYYESDHTLYSLYTILTIPHTLSAGTTRATTPPTRRRRRR